MKTLKLLLLTSALPAFALACSSEDGSNMPADSGVHDTGAPLPDTGTGGHPDASAADAPNLDAAPAPDATTFEFGTKLAELGTDPPIVVDMTPDEATVYFIQNNRLMSVASTGGTASDRGPAPDQWYAQEASYLWMYSGVTSGATMPGRGALAILAANSAAGSMPTEVTTDAVLDFVFFNDDADRAIFADHIGAMGAGATATTTADLVAYDAVMGMKRTLMTGIHVAQWDEDFGEYTGFCVPQGFFIDATRAVLSACLDPAAGPNDSLAMLLIDTTTGQVTNLVAVTDGFIGDVDDGAHFIYADENDLLQAVDADGMNTIPLNDPGAVVYDFAMLDARRFVYVTEEGALKVASWPHMTPSTLVDSGVFAIDEVSPNGGYVLFHTADDPNTGLTDLVLVATATPAAAPLILDANTDAYAGDDAFSDDDTRVYWYMNTDENYIGDIMERRTDGSDQPMQLAPAGYLVATYAEPDSVLLFPNAHIVGRGNNARVDADLAVRKNDASAPLKLLAPSANAENFLLTPNADRLIYRVLETTAAGLYLRDLPPG